MGKQVASIRVLQLLVLAMIMGNIMFLIVAIFIVRSSTPDPALKNVLYPVLLVLAGGAVLVPPVIRRAILPKVQAQLSTLPDEDPRAAALGSWQTVVLIRGAVAEGLGLFATVVFLVTGSSLALVVTLAAILLLILRIPTEAGLTRFIADASPT